MYTKYQMEGLDGRLNEIFVTCRKNGTVVLLQCSNLSQRREFSSHLRVAQANLHESAWPY